MKKISGIKMSTVKRLLKEVMSLYKFKLFYVFGFILISTGANVTGSFFIRSLIDDYINPLLASNTPDFAPLYQALLIRAFIYLAGVLSTLLYARIMFTISQGVLKKIRDDMFAHMQSLPINYFDTNSHGDIMSRFTNDSDTLREFFSQGLPQIVSSIFTIITVTISMLILSIPLSLIVFFFVALMLMVTKVVGGKAAGNFITQQKSLGMLNGYIEEMIKGQKVIKVFCHEQAAIDDFAEKNEILREQSSTANGLTNMLMPIIMSLGGIQYVAIAFIGGMMVLNGLGGITFGTIGGFLTLSRSFSSPIGQISTQINSIILALAGAERIFDLLDEASETDDGDVTLVHVNRCENGFAECQQSTGIWAWKQIQKSGEPIYTELRGDVKFYNVDFGYSPEKLVLKNISLYAKPGQKIAFVGATGAGKTTITNLLNRFYEIDSGQICIDGIDIKAIKKDDLRRSMGIVLQDTHLFSGSVKDNIQYGKLDASMDDIKNAAALANADDFIMRLPHGYDTQLTGDGNNFSGGQRQLISIARAAIANPPVMILDEATSSIDTRTEAIVQKGMDGLMKGRTVFVIAHRLSTVKNSNAIMVIEQGEIIERGDHDDLLNEKGKYYQLYTGSFAE